MEEHSNITVMEPEMRQSAFTVPSGGGLMMQPLEFTEEQKTIIKRMCQAEGLDDNEFAAFLHICKRRRLDPILRQIYATKRNKKIVASNGSVSWAKILVPIVSIEGMTAQADRPGTYAPSEKKPEFEYAQASDKAPRACTVWVKKLAHGTWHEFSFTAYFSEFSQDTDLWKKMPHHMLMKCARAGALRMGWPEDCGGLYIEEELWRDAPTDEDVAPERKKRERGSMAKLKESKEVNRGHGSEGIAEALNVPGVEKGDTAFKTETFSGNVIEVKLRENRSQSKKWLEVGVGSLSESGYKTFNCWHQSLFDCLMQKPKDVVLAVKLPTTHKGYATVEDVLSISGVKYEKGVPYKEPEVGTMIPDPVEDHYFIKTEVDARAIRDKSLLELSNTFEEIWPASDKNLRGLRNAIGQSLLNVKSKDELMALTYPQINIDAAIKALKRYHALANKPVIDVGIENLIFNYFQEAKNEIQEKQADEGLFT